MTAVQPSLRTQHNDHQSWTHRRRSATIAVRCRTGNTRREALATFLIGPPRGPSRRRSADFADFFGALLDTVDRNVRAKLAHKLVAPRSGNVQEYVSVGVSLHPLLNWVRCGGGGVFELSCGWWGSCLTRVRMALEDCCVLTTFDVGVVPAHRSKPLQIWDKKGIVMWSCVG